VLGDCGGLGERDGVVGGDLDGSRAGAVGNEVLGGGHDDLVGRGDQISAGRRLPGGCTRLLSGWGSGDGALSSSDSHSPAVGQVGCEHPWESVPVEVQVGACVPVGAGEGSRAPRGQELAAAGAACHAECAIWVREKPDRVAPALPGQPFSEFKVGLDHVCLTVDSAERPPHGDSIWTRAGLHLPASARECGHHINLRDPGKIAVELFLLEPDEVSAEILAPGRRRSSLMHSRG
jgi:hypothetical protein